jgi:hypothetical protein
MWKSAWTYPYDLETGFRRACSGILVSPGHCVSLLVREDSGLQVLEGWTIVLGSRQEAVFHK